MKWACGYVQVVAMTAASAFSRGGSYYGEFGTVFTQNRGRMECSARVLRA